MKSHMTRVILSAALRLGTFVLCLLAAQAASAQVPAEYLGDWVLSTAQCSVPVRVRFESATITLINGTDRESFGGIEMAGPGYFEPGYRGIMAVAFAEFSGDQPVIATFNVNEKKGVAQLDFAAPTPVRSPNATLTALNARYTKLNLAKRFPLNAKPLKKCPGPARS